MPVAGNAVSLAGKVSRVGRLAYTPSGVAIREVVLAFPQEFFGVSRFGYCDLLFIGEKVGWVTDRLKIGRPLAVEGCLWTRKYRNKQGNLEQEFKIIVEKIGEVS